MKTSSHIVFDRAESQNTEIDNEEKHGASQAINLGSDNIFYAPMSQDEQSPTTLTCHCTEALADEEVKILEIAFHKGKHRKTKFSVDYIDSEDKKHHIGTYESSGETNNYEKFVFPDKVKDLKAVVIAFKSNSDGWPFFSVKGIRLARFIEKTL